MLTDFTDKVKLSFNPCFSGRYSAIYTGISDNMVNYIVSILVLVEGTLQFSHSPSLKMHQTRFNPCFSGRYSAI